MKLELNYKMPKNAKAIVLLFHRLGNSNSGMEPINGLKVDVISVSEE